MCFSVYLSITSFYLSITSFYLSIYLSNLFTLIKRVAMVLPYSQVTDLGALPTCCD